MKTRGYLNYCQAQLAQERLDLEFRGARVYITSRPKIENGNSGLFGKMSFAVDYPRTVPRRPNV
jgi:hypothetical protein